MASQPGTDAPSWVRWRYRTRGFRPAALLQRVLLDGLADDVEVRLGLRWSAVEQNSAQAWVTLEDGTTSAADLVIDASGIWSACADSLLGTVTSHRGYGGILAISDSVGEPPRGRAQEYWGSGERFGLFEVTGNRRYVFYMRDEVAGTPPPTLAEVARRACGWACEIGNALAACDEARSIPFSIHARSIPRRLGDRRILCVGDAAHAMEPNLGQGGCQGIEDAAILGAIAAARPPLDVLPMFERARLDRVASIARRSASAGRFVHGGAALGAVGRVAMALVPDAVHRRVVVNGHRFPEATLTPAI
ncbi:NAD(P)/FAD-dependent oxidoreductase [Sphingomonas sp.]|uniref:NAD(P)/FAD-dependent oxidoreductase n=1 Tax=Sphingomonas sp. TaxID=28214 RepID=UPI002EDA6A1C